MDKDARIELVMGKNVVGIDVAKSKHDAVINDCHGRTIRKPFRFQNNIDGFERLAVELEQVKKASGADVVIGMEPTGHYWKPLAYWLGEQGYLVVLVNPMHVKRHKEDWDNSPSKSDKKDTMVIAGQVRDGKFMQVLLPRGIYADLRELTVTRQSLKQNLNSGMNQLKAVLDEYFPEYHEVFKGALGQASRWVLEKCPFPSHIEHMEIEELVAGLKAASTGRVGQKRAEQLIEQARRSIGVREGLEGAYRRLSSILAEVEFVKRQLEQTEALMAQKLEATGLAAYLLSMPGIGVVTAASFLGEIGDPRNYDNWRQIRNLAGLNLMENSSGKHESRTVISKRGRCSLRCLLYQISLTMVATNPHFQALYHHFLTRSINPLQKKQALVAIGLKVLRVMFGLVTNHEVYDAAKMLGEVRKEQLALAA